MDKQIPYPPQESDSNLLQIDRRNHPYGIIWEASECNILEKYNKGSLLIAPFHDHRYTYNILLWNPKTLRLLHKFSADRIWKLWDNYYATFQKDLSYVDNIQLYSLTGKGMRKMKNVSLDSIEYSFTEVKRIVGSKALKAIYIMEDLWVGVVNLNSEEIQEWASEELILQAFICEELRILVVCTEEQVMIHQLDETGRIEEEAIYTLPLTHKFGSAYLENNELTVISVQEDEDKGVSSIYVSRYELGSEGYEDLGDGERLLLTVYLTKYDFEFLMGSKVFMCISDHEPLMLVSLEKGEVILKSPIIGKLLKVDPEEGSMFISSYTALLKLSVDVKMFS